MFTAANLEKWAMADRIDDAVLVVSELVTNAVNASNFGSTVKVWLWTDGESILIEVRDSAPGIPLLVHPAPDEVNGRGLAVVAALSVDWGCFPGSRGTKIVWASLRPTVADAAIAG